MKTKQNHYRSLAVALALASGCGAAQAQQGTARTESLEEIIVTATRREERLQAVPLSIAAISGEALQASGADDIRVLADRVPGVELVTLSPGLNRITIRGISNFGEIGEATVGYYIDEMPVSADPAAQPDIKMFDIDRIEFLRGPQGTLFGESSLGGTVRILLNKPDPTAWAADLEGELATIEDGGENYSANAMINVPVVADRLALRVAGTFRKNDGWIDNVGLGIEDINEEESWSVRSSARVLVTDAVTLTGTWIHNETDIEGIFFANGDREQITGTREPRADAFDQYSLVAEIGAPLVDITATASYFERDTFRPRQELGFLSPVLTAFFGIPFTSAGTDFRLDYEIFAGEVRVASNGDGPFGWLIGAFYKDSKRFESRDFYSDPALPLPPSIVFASVDSDTTFEQSAIFGEANYRLTDKLRITAGARYFEEDQSGFTENAGLLFDALGQAVVAEEEGSASEITPRFIVDYSVTEDVLLYASAAEGFRSGGTNRFAAFVVGTDVPREYEPDTLWNYELGAKTSWREGRLIANAAAYYIDWKDVQIGVTPDGSTFGYIDNLGSATSKGVELELTARPIDALTLTASGNYTDSTIDEAVPGGAKGNRLPYVPEYKLSLSGQYRLPVTSALDAVLFANYSRVGERFDDLANQQRLAAYDLIGLRATLESKSGWEVSLFADNLTDETIEYFLFDSASPIGAEYYTNRPRTIGLNARMRF